MVGPDDSIHVLHVDDDPDFLDLTQHFMAREGDRFTVKTATHASDGLGILDSHDIDCIVSDYDMPGITGIEFLKRVRADTDDLPFILFTGKGSEEIASKAISAGVTDYLQKGGGSDQYTILANRIRNAVERRRAERGRERMRKRMELALEETNSRVFEFDFASSQVSRHGSLDRFLGPDIEEIATHAEYVQRVVHPADRDRFTSFYESLRTGADDGGTIEYRTHPDLGDVQWLRDMVYVIGDTGDGSRVLGLSQDITEQKERERELERHEAYLQESTDIFGVLDEEGRLKYESPSIERILGYSPGELIGQNVFEYVHPEDRDRVYERFATLLDNPDATVTVECRFEAADGGYRWLGVRGTNQLDNPAVNGIVTNNRDITERKQEERERQRIIERVSDAIVEVTQEWELSLVNDRAEELCDMSEEALLGRNFWAVFEAALDTPFEDAFRTAMESREFTAITDYYDGLDGWFEIEVYPTDDGGLAFYFVEVSDRHEREARLEEVTERFEYVESVGNIGYWEIDTTADEPYPVTLSAGGNRLYGLSPDETLDLDQAIGLYHPADRDHVRESFELAFTDGTPFEFDARLTGEDQDRWVHAVGEPIDCDGEITGIRGVLKEVTDRLENQE